MKSVYAHIIFLFLSCSFNAHVLLAQIVPNNEIAVIVSSSVRQDSISNETLLNIYTLRIRNWDDGTRITVSDYRGNSDIRNHFYRYLGTQVNTIKKIWLRAQFTGKITPPRTVDSVEEMVSTVMENPGTIGYVPINQVPEDAIILLIIYHD